VNTQQAKPDLLDRTRSFALQIIRLVDELPNKPTGWIIGKQVLRSGTSVGANYREAQRARSKAEFISKIQICRQELEETRYWLELLYLSGNADQVKCQDLLRESTELIAIFTTIGKRVDSSATARGSN
jgi:four helix bundle protein